MLWVWGLRPLAFPSSDEAVDRFAALLIRKNGEPFLKLPFPDPEDLAHPRSWISVGDNALPTYAPVMLYAYGLLTKLRNFGYLLIACVPAAGAAAFAAGTARLLPPGRRGIALLAPALGFPALYWLIRPWINLSTLLSCVCWAFFYWASWRKSENPWTLGAALFSAGAAAAVRPDYAPYVMLIVLLFSLGAKPSEWKRICVLAIAAGALALGLNLILNHLETGHAFRAAYQMSLDRDYGDQGGHGFVGVLKTLLLPMGWPTRSAALTYVTRYWVKMGNTALLLGAQLAIIPVFFRLGWLARALYGVGILLMIVFMLSRTDDGLFGAAEVDSWVAHSIPRYWSPVYLLAALPPILFVGHCKRRIVVYFGTLCLCGLGGLSLFEIYKRQPGSILYLERFVRTNAHKLDYLARSIPPNGIVYSLRLDKILWSRWTIGMVDQPAPTVASIKRALATGRPVFLLDPRVTRETHRLKYELRRQHLALTRVNAREGLYRIDLPGADVPEQ